MKTVLGCDPSTKTGLAVVKNGEVVYTGRIETSKEEDIHIRAARIVKGVEALLDEYDVELVSIEGYAMNGGFTIIQMVTIGAMLRAAFFRKGVEWFEIPPKKLKQLITGKGTATKADMSQHVLRRFGIKPKNNDIADAIALAMVGHHAYNLETMSKSVGFVYASDVLETAGV